MVIKKNGLILHRQTIRTDKNNKEMDLQKVMKYYNVSTSDVARALFPSIKYPVVALNRVIENGCQELTETQIEKLAEFIGCEIMDLYACESWAARTEGGFLTFRKGEYSAKVDTKGCVAYLYWGALNIDKRLYSPGMKITEFCDMVEKAIEELKTNGKKEKDVQ